VHYLSLVALTDLKARWHLSCYQVFAINVQTTCKQRDDKQQQQQLGLGMCFPSTRLTVCWRWAWCWLLLAVALRTTRKSKTNGHEGNSKMKCACRGELTFLSSPFLSSPFVLVNFKMVALGLFILWVALGTIIHLYNLRQSISILTVLGP